MTARPDERAVEHRGETVPDSLTHPAEGWLSVLAVLLMVLVVAFAVDDAHWAGWGPGGSQTDFGQAIALDASSNAFVTGNTASPTFPATVGVIQVARGGNSPTGDAFLIKIGPAAIIGQNKGGDLEMPTFIRKERETATTIDKLTRKNLSVDGEDSEYDIPTFLRKKAD